jgi:hypothetical protein
MSGVRFFFPYLGTEWKVTHASTVAGRLWLMGEKKEEGKKEKAFY